MTNEEFETAGAIAKRARVDFNHNQATAFMDIVGCMKGGCDLDLPGLLGAADGDFVHDLRGINHNLDHVTYKLKNCFSPRYSRCEA